MTSASWLCRYRSTRRQVYCLILLGWLTDAAKGVVTTAEEKIGDANANTPVGTTQALIEQGAKVFSSIHARFTERKQNHLRFFLVSTNWYLEEMDNQSGTEIEIRDFASNNDVRPVSDPNIFSETQRLAQAQAVLQMANSAPQMYDLRAAHRRVLKQLKVPAINEILPDPEGIKESNPALENVAMSMGRPAAAYPDQDHLAHIKVHLAYAQDPNYGGSPLIGPTFAPHALEHIKQHLTLHYSAVHARVRRRGNGRSGQAQVFSRSAAHPGRSAGAVPGRRDGLTWTRRTTFQAAQPDTSSLRRKVQQAQQAKMEQMAAQDPTAQVIAQDSDGGDPAQSAGRVSGKAAAGDGKAPARLPTQGGRAGAQGAGARCTKFQTAKPDQRARRTPRTSRYANINNASRERVAQVQTGAQMDAMQAQLAHEQNMSAIDAINMADADMRKHGIQAARNSCRGSDAAVYRRNKRRRTDDGHAPGSHG
jgi:hypothetical protein